MQYGTENMYKHTHMLSFSLHYILTQYGASSRSNTYSMWQTPEAQLKTLIAIVLPFVLRFVFWWLLYSVNFFLTIRCLSFLLIKGSLHLCTLLPLTSLFWFSSHRYIHYLCIFNDLMPTVSKLQNKTFMCNILHIRDSFLCLHNRLFLNLKARLGQS